MAELGLSRRNLVERSRLWGLSLATVAAAGDQHIRRHATSEAAVKAVAPEE